MKIDYFALICEYCTHVMKTNKSFTKRIKVTKNGTLVMRKAGQNHFNSKEGSRSQMARNRTLKMVMKNKAKSRFLNNSSI